MGKPNFSEDFKRDAVHPLPDSRNAVSMRRGSRYVDIRFVRFQSDWVSALIHSTNG